MEEELAGLLTHAAFDLLGIEGCFEEHPYHRAVTDHLSAYPDDAGLASDAWPQSDDPLLSDYGDTRQMHGYAYSNQSPVNYSDPDGLHAEWGPDGLIGDSSEENASTREHQIEVQQTAIRNTRARSQGPATTITSSSVTGSRPGARIIVEPTEVIVPQVGGFFKGAGEYLRDTVTGNWDMVSGAFSTVNSCRQGLWNPAAATDCQGAMETGMLSLLAMQSADQRMGEAMVAPVVDSWSDGDYGEASGYAFMMVIEAIAGTKGLGNTSRGARTAARACSFDGETEVVMANRSVKPIAEVEVGDEVLATDPETGEQAAREVLHVFVHEDTLLDLDVDGKTLTTTADHPFWSVDDEEFIRADQLNPGDNVLSADARALTVEGLQVETARQDTAYNLEVADIHTYHVGEQEILVHNICRDRLQNAGLSDAVIDEVERTATRASQGKERAPGHDGKRFHNRFGDLPQQPDGYYREWTVAPEGAKRGKHRLIIGGDKSNPDVMYYWDHESGYIEIGP
ncbi:polymorphic toxin-type HINT domain-containing protein [Haloechinothrix sp. LS1_15]|uniref:polymorphic toxin-type HINT domain-containing protein n=1 Tax=Haloechinothrix sp. LS1_15 TaxID=2652248 RepID=UPI00294B4189|nr:polymorphic toxin-type HINT domain-containing protein [Haloechinothrix sp. LS1_15]